MSLGNYVKNVNQISKDLINSGIIDNLQVVNNLVNPPMFSKSQDIMLSLFSILFH